MASIKLMLNKARVLKSGEYPLVFQLIHRRKKKLIYSSYRLFEDEFDLVSAKILYRKKGRFTRKQVKEMNKTLCDKMSDIDSVIVHLLQNRPDFQLEDIMINYDKQKKCRYLDVYMKQQIDMKLKLDKIGMAKSYKSTLNSLLTFTENKPIAFDSIDYNFLYAYEQFLIRRKVMPNTVAFYMRNFRSAYNRAEKEGYEVALKNPFRSYSIRTEKTIKRALDKEVIKRIANLDLSSHPAFVLSRDIFMFSFYTRGMSFVDIACLKSEELANGMVDYRRNKTGQHLLVMTTLHMQKLIDKYIKVECEYVFPLLSGGTPAELYKQYRAALWRTNRNLKKIAKMIGLSVPLTMNMARHSWATVAKNTGAPISAISDSLGHTTEKTTQIYLRELDMQILNVLNERVSSL